MDRQEQEERRKKKKKKKKGKKLSSLPPGRYFFLPFKGSGLLYLVVSEQIGSTRFLSQLRCSRLKT